MDSLIAANSKFCFDFFQEISKRDIHKNVFVCPLSLSAACAMIRLGARGDSAEQIDEVLHFNEVSKDKSKEPNDPQSKSEKEGSGGSLKGQKETPGSQDQQDEATNENEVLSYHFGNLLSKLDRDKSYYTLTMANRLYGEQEFPICPEYSDDVIQFYHTTVESVDFRKDTEKSRQEINFWVESQCQGKIKELFAKEAIDNSTVLVLVNAVYFKAKWEKHFDCENTVDEPFFLSENEKKTVKMMNQKGRFQIGFIEELQAQILEMKYTVEKLSMLVLLPSCSEDNVKSLQELEKKISHEKLMAWSSSENMSEEPVAISFPQFIMEDNYDLKSVLQDMGIKDVFDETKADLTGISKSPNLHLSKIVHRSFVEVDEMGTQAVAASGVVGAEKALPSWVEFKANHPFLFFIRHNPTQVILFCGRVYSP
ncbi:serpin B12 [Meriones unguiculatus]|uniref:serpin B12 n=1 Tax=Meriones unguiculatus TaxID=10047 RepID=UPI000B4EFE87|nr:serpin B12 [Meriones unguiculatus]XP_060227467.1 serpin B12 [Meriones unguiculatus]XP_060227468.1 serpin B12 [Meriones unguiculatus]XP_060227469.1 serpin B12 [Meriones unguiculatus]XP_060227470.1 serpin B12 [Meriones unguiculatus]